MTLTMEKLQEAVRLVEQIERSTGRPIYPTPFNGIRVIEDPNCLAATTERRFPASKHRSKRILKKLIKRHGSEFVMVPAIFQYAEMIIAHPVRYAELKRRFAPARSVQL